MRRPRGTDDGDIPVVTDRFNCPVQTTETFSFDTCRGCKYLTVNRGTHMTIRCRKNKDTQDARAFESAFLLDYIGMDYKVEIIEEVTK